MVIENWHNFVKTKNISILDSLLSENIIFYSPVVHSPQIGFNISKKYLKAASIVLFNSSFKYEYIKIMNIIESVITTINELDPE